MGIDLLDFSFRVEKYFGVRKLLEPLQNDARCSEILSRIQNREPIDLQVGELLELVLMCSPEQPLRCIHCKSKLNNFGFVAHCHQCSVPFDPWLTIQRITAETCFVEPEEVTPESFIFKDLGFS